MPSARWLSVVRAKHTGTSYLFGWGDGDNKKGGHWKVGRRQPKCRGRWSKCTAPLKTTMVQHVLSCHFLMLLIVTVKGTLNQSHRSEDPDLQVWKALKCLQSVVYIMWNEEMLNWSMASSAHTPSVKTKSVKYSTDSNCSAQLSRGNKNNF